ncbi:LysR family transcriptional regulator [Hyalangium minutum]|uniref:Transcriptional regulator, LysR family protein n=1 Tax=Hyalangium minutum TaxID=394096 RepID=A0A085W4T4_9BACT|nr:LysR family transcriptional regulator [Hyalangium minutum]KFE62697.1 Transcriptional regulator, LysR family protein [Hyalangium minutum]
MTDINLATVDLNLLNVVATVLEERSATKAAVRLHVTQSAVSNAMKRARELFGDPLVLREAYGLAPTARGAELLPALRAWLEEARRLVAKAPVFEPRTSTRTFTVACSDAVAVALLQPVLRLLKKRAPLARLRLQTLDRLLSEDGLARGEVDLLIGIPPVVPPGHEAELVYRDPLECIVRRDHPRVRSKLTLPLYASLPHVELALFGNIDDTIDRALARHGQSREVTVVLPHFSSVPLAVLETDCVATLSSRLARAFAARLPLKVLEPPLALEPLEVRQVWHRRSEADAAVGFLRALVREAAR